MNSLACNLANLTKLKSGVERLTLTDFRNYAHLRLNAAIAPIIVHGENGSGKTNILEAISFLTPGRGLRGARLADIKRFIPQINGGGNFSFISPLNWAVAAEIVNNGESFNIATAVEKAPKKLKTVTDTVHSNGGLLKLTATKFPLKPNWDVISRLFGLRRKWTDYSEEAANRDVPFLTVWFMLLIWNMLNGRLILNICIVNGTA